MFEIEFNISKLIAGHFRGQLNADQKEELNRWLNLSAENQTYFNELTNEATIVKELKKFNSLRTPAKTETWNKALNKIERDEKQDFKPAIVKTGRYKLWTRISAAAAILVVFGIGLWFYVNKSNDQLLTNDITPGKHTATLTLANGKKIILSNAANGELAKEAGVSISKTADGQLVYQIKDSTVETNTINTLSTAKGETYMVTLPDHSKVWLNAASSIKYPANFASLKKRQVELTGEAYFEVAKVSIESQVSGIKTERRMPFIVKTAKQEVEVLGTHFNINSYVDEPTVKTTLLEGSVRVTYTSRHPELVSVPRNRNTGDVVLNPGQQANLFPSGNIEVSIADASAIAWKNGLFEFKDADLATVMRQIARWYNIEVVYEGPVPEGRITGKIYRNMNISKVLEILKNLHITFKIEGTKIILINN